MNPEDFEGTPEYYNKQNTNSEKIPTDKEFQKVKAETTRAELNLQHIIYLYQNATAEQKKEIIDKMKKDGYDDMYIYDNIIYAAEDEFVPKSRR